MKSKQNLLNQAAKTIARKMIEKDSEGWPPDSPCGFYQPVRPQGKTSIAHSKSAAVKAPENS